MHACMHGCIHPSIHAAFHTSIQGYIHRSMHAYIDPSFHSSIHQSMHASIHTPIHSCIHPTLYASYIHPSNRLPVFHCFVHVCNFFGAKSLLWYVRHFCVYIFPEDHWGYENVGAIVSTTSVFFLYFRWHYAYICILEETVRRRRRMWSWDHIKQHRIMVKGYIILWVKYLSGEKFSPDQQRLLEVNESFLKTALHFMSDLCMFLGYRMNYWF